VAVLLCACLVQGMELDEKQRQKKSEHRKTQQRTMVKRMEMDVGEVMRQARCNKAQVRRAARRGEATETLRQEKKQPQHLTNLRKPKDNIKACKFGAKCSRVLCHFNHPRRRFIDTDCRNGSHCQRRNCCFKHPSAKASQTQQQVKRKDSKNSRARATGYKRLTHQAPKQQVQRVERSDSGVTVAFDALGL